MNVQISHVLFDFRINDRHIHWMVEFVHPILSFLFRLRFQYSRAPSSERLFWRLCKVLHARCGRNLVALSIELRIQ
jgi:hypothetical protein